MSKGVSELSATNWHGRSDLVRLETPSPSGRRRGVPAIGCTLALAWALLAGAGSVSATPPTVNGLFYGDGDDARYVEYATSYLGSKLYISYDAATATLYTALVVSPSVNDNVFGSPDGGTTYMSSVGWGGGHGQQRGADKLTDSEFAQFTFACAPGSPNTWTWSQGYACQSGSTWVADMTCPTSTGTAPPGYVSASSFARNINVWEAAATKPWDRDVQGTRLRDWVSPFDAAQTPPLALGLDGYPSLAGSGFSTVYDYEWRMVYEWSVPLGPTGADCGGNLLYVVTGLSHHSPLKEELGVPPPECGDPENDCFPGDITSSDPLSDFGDLPDSYGTTSASNGPHHYITFTGPYLGQEVVFELDGQPSTDALGDGAEEDGVTAVVDGNWTAGSTRTINVVVGNAAAGALLGAWFDWNGDGDLADAGEFFSWPVSEGTNPLTVTVGTGFDWATDVLYARFRLFSAGAVAPGGSLDQGDSVGVATDGEVEDYVWDAGTLPVTLNAFSSAGDAGDDVSVAWQTASETDNVGFELWGRVGSRWQVLGDFIPASDTDSRLPHDYTITIAAPPGLAVLQLVDIDSHGAVGHYGPFRIGARYGEVQPERRIDWAPIEAEREGRLVARGFAPVAGPGADQKRASNDRQLGWKRLAGGGPVNGSGVSDSTVREVEAPVAGGVDPAVSRKSIRFHEGTMTHVAVTEPGVQRVTYEALRDGGLDLVGVPAGEIAISRRGAAVARFIDGPKTFGPGSTVEFIGSPPEGDDALYVSANTYQVTVDRRLVRDAKQLPWGAMPRVSPAYLKEVTVDRPVRYHSQSPTGDPWIESLALARTGSPATVTLDIEVGDEVLDGACRLMLDLGTITDLPDIADAGGAVVPEHNVEVWFSGPDSDFLPVTTSSTSGQGAWHIEADLPSGLLEPGLNRVRLRFSTNYIFSLVAIDRYGVRFPTSYRGPALDFAADPTAHGYRVEGFENPDVVAYSQTRDGGLVRHEVAVFPSTQGYAVELRQAHTSASLNRAAVAGASERFWVTGEPKRPAVFTTEASGDLLAEPAGLVVISGSSFVGTQALEDYVASKAEYDPVVVDVEDIYNAVGYGMALPSAITDYLAARREVHPFDHVQLVGSDCYDRRNYVSQCISFVPLPSAAVGFTRYSPSHNRLGDLDGDGVADVAVAQFSVRTEAELATIVGKEQSWHASGLAAADSALLVAEEGDGTHDFRAQTDRIGGRLDAAVTDVLDMTDHPDVATAREAFRAALDAGRAVTVFSGHSSSVMWAYRGLLTAQSVASLTNSDLPTIILPLACETTYDVSPTAEVLGHQLLVAGDQGAVAITGAVSLASLDDNERMADYVLAGLESGLTLGEAVQAGRTALGRAYQTLQDNWLTQGDVTLRMER